MVRDIAINAIIPHLEKEARNLHVIIQNRKALHRSIFSATKKFFGGSQSKNYVTEKYTESVEIQQRRLGDLCFLLQQYDVATGHYQSAKRFCAQKIGIQGAPKKLVGWRFSFYRICILRAGQLSGQFLSRLF